MPNIRVNSGVMSNVHGDISNGASTLANQLDTMDSQLRPLMANWTGSAQEAYNAAKANWTQDLDHLRVVLTEIAQLVTEHSENMMASDQRGAGRFSAY